MAQLLALLTVCACEGVRACEQNAKRLMTVPDNAMSE
jgi:hypothetical protein